MKNVNVKINATVTGFVSVPDETPDWDIENGIIDIYFSISDLNQDSQDLGTDSYDITVITPADSFDKKEKQYILDVLEKEGLDYGLTCYTDFREEVSNEDFHVLLTKYNDAKQLKNYVEKAEIIVELSKLLKTDLYTLGD